MSSNQPTEVSRNPPQARETPLVRCKWSPLFLCRTDRECEQCPHVIGISGTGTSVRDNPAVIPELTDQDLATRLSSETRFARVVHVVRCTTTQELAANDPAGDQAVFWADHQTDGRGRQDRRWDDGPGLALTVTFRLQLALENPAELPAIAPLCVLQAIEPLIQRKLRLKWPNDVYLDSRKLAGILIDTNADGGGTYLVGIGINVNRTSIPRELEGKATSLALATGHEYARTSLLIAVATQLDAVARALTQGEDGALANYLARYRDRLGLMNRRVIADDGALHEGVLVALDFGEIRFANGQRFPLGQLRGLRATD